MPRFLPLETVRRVALKALANGGTCYVSRDGMAYLTHVQWNVAGKCQAPVLVELWARPYKDKLSYRPSGVPPQARRYFVSMDVKCRKCEACLMDRAAHWRLRALAEYSQAPRSWLITTTFTPEYQQTALNKARRKLGKQGIDFETLDPAEQFQLRHNETQKELTLFFKRLYKTCGKFRYLLVAEAHKSGAPHYHVVLHETVLNTVKHADIKDKWRVGFVDAKLITDKKAATYACKYLTKSALARVRASQNYGGYEYNSITASSPSTVPMNVAWKGEPLSEQGGPATIKEKIRLFLV